MATLTRQVSQSSDDAGEVEPAPDNVDPVLATLSSGTSGMEVGEDIQARIDATPNGGTLVFPNSRLFWVQGGLEVLNRTNLTIEFNNCTIWRKKEFNTVQAELTADITATDLSFEISGRSGETFLTSAAGKLTGTAGWLSGTVGLALQYDAWIGSGTYNTSRERVTVTAVAASSGGRANITLTSRGPATDPPGSFSGIARRAWPAGTLLEMTEENNWRIVRMNGGTRVRFLNLKVLGNAASTLPNGQTVTSGGDRRESQSALEIIGTQDFLVDGYSAEHVYGDGIFFGFGEPWGRVVSDGYIRNLGRQGISLRDRAPGGLIIEGRPGGAPFNIGDPNRPDFNTIRNSEVDIEPYTDRAGTTNVTFRHLNFTSGAQFNSRGNGDEVADIVLDDITVPYASVGMLFSESSPGTPRHRLTIKNCVGGREGTQIGRSGHPEEKSGIQLSGVYDLVLTNNVLPNRPDQYGVTLVNGTVKTVSGNDIGRGIAAVRMILKTHTPGTNEGFTFTHIGSVASSYPRSLTANTGRFFHGADWQSGIPDVIVDAPIEPPTDVTMDIDGINQLLLTNGGDGSAGPRVFFVDGSTTFRNKNQWRCDHGPHSRNGGSTYAAVPVGLEMTGGSPVDDWGDPFPNSSFPTAPNLPQPPAFTPANPSRAAGGDWWVVVVDVARNRSYEYWGYRVDAGNVPHFNWGACYDLLGDGNMAIANIGAGSAAGLSQLAGLLRPFELTGDNYIDHPLVFTSNIVRGPVDAPGNPGPRRWPATRTSDGGSSSLARVPLGARLWWEGDSLPFPRGKISGAIGEDVTTISSPQFAVIPAITPPATYDICLCPEIDNLREFVTITSHGAGSTSITCLRHVGGVNSGGVSHLAGTRWVKTRAGVDISGWTQAQLKIAHALRVYGAYMNDQGGDADKFAFPSQAFVGMGAGPLPFTIEEFSFMDHWDGSPYKSSGSRSTDEGFK